LHGFGFIRKLIVDILRRCMNNSYLFLPPEITEIGRFPLHHGFERIYPYPKK